MQALLRRDQAIAKAAEAVLKMKQLVRVCVCVCVCVCVSVIYSIVV
jgi:hypothetical protein